MRFTRAKRDKNAGLNRGIPCGLCPNLQRQVGIAIVDDVGWQPLCSANLLRRDDLAGREGGAIFADILEVRARVLVIQAARGEGD
jgi:hypothetical protein